MADNVTADAGSGGATFAAAQLSFSGDTVVLPIGAQGLLSGSEGSWTFVLQVGGAGSVTSGTPRVTLASDDPAVTALGSIKTAVETLDNAISGSEMQVDVVGALPAGTNAIGKLAANSGVDIGDVDVTSVPTDPFGANADAASATGSISAKLRFIASTGIPITGTVTVGSHNVTNAGTFAVQSTLQAGDSTVGRVKLTDGTDVADILDLSNSNPLTVAIVDGSGDQITSFGGGTQYTEGDTDASITGTAMLWEDTSNTLRSVSASKPLPVEIVAGAGSGGTAAADDADFTAGSTSGTPVMGVYESSPTSITAGDMGIVGLTQTRAVRTVVEGTVTVGSHPVTNAGTFAVQVDGSALTALQKIDDPVLVDDAAFTPGSSSVMMFGAQLDNSGTDSVDEGDAGALRMASNRCLYVNVRDNAGNERGLNIDSSGNLTANITGTVTVGSHNVTNAGTFAVQVDGSALTSLQLIDDPVFSDDSAFTPGTSKVMVSGFQADESSTDSVDEGDAGAARMTLDRKQITTVQPHTAGGVSIFRSLDLDETEEDIKTSAGQLYGFYAFNASTSIRYLKFYNATAASVTVGSTAPVLTIPIPAATSGGVGMVFAPCSANGIPFDTAISAAATTGLADADTGAPSANDVVLNAFYK